MLQIQLYMVDIMDTKLIGVEHLMISSVRYMSMPQSLFVQLLIKQNISYLKPKIGQARSKRMQKLTAWKVINSHVQEATVEANKKRELKRRTKKRTKTRCA